jgi:hypothetical protein
MRELKTKIKRESELQITHGMPTCCCMKTECKPCWWTRSRAGTEVGICLVREPKSGHATGTKRKPTEGTQQENTAAARDQSLVRSPVRDRETHEDQIGDREMTREKSSRKKVKALAATKTKSQKGYPAMRKEQIDSARRTVPHGHEN